MAESKKAAKKKSAADLEKELQKAAEAARKAGVEVHIDTSYVDDDGVSRENRD